MKRILAIVTALFLAAALSSCAKQDLVDMKTVVTDDYAAIEWDDRTYVPYGGLSAYGDRGIQIGFVDGNQDHKVYECKGYSPKEWIVAALPYDAPMLYREISVTEIPDGWQSEYSWNQ